MAAAGRLSSLTSDRDVTIAPVASIQRADCGRSTKSEPSCRDFEPQLGKEVQGPGVSTRALVLKEIAAPRA